MKGRRVFQNNLFQNQGTDIKKNRDRCQYCGFFPVILQPSVKQDKVRAESEWNPDQKRRKHILHARYKRRKNTVLKNHREARDQPGNHKIQIQIRFSDSVFMSKRSNSENHSEEHFR